MYVCLLSCFCIDRPSLCSILWPTMARNIPQHPPPTLLYIAMASSYLISAKNKKDSRQKTVYFLNLVLRIQTPWIFEVNEELFMMKPLAVYQAAPPIRLWLLAEVLGLPSLHTPHKVPCLDARQSRVHQRGISWDTANGKNTTIIGYIYIYI